MQTQRLEDGEKCEVRTVADLFHGFFCILVLLDVLLGLVVGRDEGAAHGPLILLRLDTRDQLCVPLVHRGRLRIDRTPLTGGRQGSEGNHGVRLLRLVVVVLTAHCRVVHR